MTNTSDNEKPELWLIRHGETEWSLSGAHTSRTDIPLTARGEERAAKIRDYLAHRKFSLVLTSPLQRARETCRVAGYADVAQIDENLREWDYGIYEGRTTAEIRAGNDGDGTVELPSGARLVRCDGRSATSLAAARGVPVVVVDRALDDATATGMAVAAGDGCPASALDEAVGLLQSAGLAVYVIDDAPGLVVTRTVAMLVNGAVDARHKGVASAADIDTAMRLGTNYPLGPLAWGQSWGPAAVLAVLDALHAWYGEDRYRASALLRRIAAAGGSLT